MSKIMVNIEFKEAENANCIQSLYCSVVNWKNTDYRLLFLYTWTFWFDEKNKGCYPIIGARYGRKMDRFPDILDQAYSGAFNKMDVSQNFSNEIVTMVYEDFRENKPVIIGINLYWCPWSEKYKQGEGYADKRVNPDNCNFILAVGMDFAAGIIYCKEKNTNNEMVALPFDDLVQGCKKIYWLGNDVIHEPHISWTQTVRKALEYTIQNDYSVNTFINMRHFASFFKDASLDLLAERHGFGDLYIADIPIVDGTMNIGRARRQFAIALTYIADRFGLDQLLPICAELNKLCDKWYCVKNVLLKAFLKNSITATTKERVAQMINELSYEEEEAYYRLSSLVG